MKTYYFSIGKLAEAVNCRVETVHFYEKKGLMPEPPRTGGGHRVYTTMHLKRLNFIRRSRELDFTVKQVQDLLKFVDEPSHRCGEVKEAALIQVKDIERKIVDLQRLKKSLEEMISQCKADEAPVDDCPIMNVLYAEDHRDLICK